MLTDGTSKSFATKEDAEKDVLAKTLFELEGVESVFYLAQFVSVTKSPETDWDKLSKQVSEILETFDISQLVKGNGGEGAAADNGGADDLLAKINEVIDAQVRPALAGDGGGLEILGVEDNTVRVRYQGACGSCPSSIQGTLVAIENLIKENVDPNLKVVAV